MVAQLFDSKLRALRRDRASRATPELFLHQRAFDDCLDRLRLVHRRFGSTLLIGCPDPRWGRLLEDVVDRVEVMDPGQLFAEAAGGRSILEDSWEPPPRAYELCVAIGTLDTVNDLPRALELIRAALTTDSLLIGAMAGGDTLPRLRSAMRAADQITGASSPHVHPRIEPASLAALLGATGFIMPVVDVDRVDVAYPSFQKLVDDLRGMGATNILVSRPRRPLSRTAAAEASAAFGRGGSGTLERFEILHFAAWTPADPDGQSKLRRD